MSSSEANSAARLRRWWRSKRGRVILCSRCGSSMCRHQQGDIECRSESDPSVSRSCVECERLSGTVLKLIERASLAEYALQRIADMPTEPRLDGTFNYCRAALIDIARDALDD